MKQFKFLLKYMQLFESNSSIRDNKKIVDKIAEILESSPAMKAIKSLREDVPTGGPGSVRAKEEERGAKWIQPQGMYFIEKTPTRYHISFKENFSRVTAEIEFEPDFITLNPDGSFNIKENPTFIFVTGEQTSSQLSQKPEIKAAGSSYFRELKPEEAKNKFKELLFPVYLQRTQSESVLIDNLRKKDATEIIKKVKNCAEMFQKKGEETKDQFPDFELPRIVLNSSPLPEPSNSNVSLEDWKQSVENWYNDSYKKLQNFQSIYNQQMTPKRKAALQSGETKTISKSHTDFEIKHTTNNLEDCLKWAWAYFVSRKTSRVLDALKTFNYLYKTKKGAELLDKKLPIGSRYYTIEELENDGGIGSALSKDKEFIKTAIVTKKEKSLLSEVGEHIVDMGKTANFLKSAYKDLGLNIELLEKGWAAGGFYGRTEITRAESEKSKTPVDFTEGNIGEINISPILSTKGTILGAASETFTEDVVKYMNNPLIFTLEKRKEFKYDYNKQQKIYSRVSPGEIFVTIESRTEEELFQRLLFADSDPINPENPENPTSLLIQAFSTRKSVIVGEGEEKPKKHIIDLILDFTEALKDNIKELVPNFSNELGAEFDIPETANKETINKCLKIAISKQRGKTKEIKNILQTTNSDLYKELYGSEEEKPKTGKKSRLKLD